jgi:hypothetical protein
MEITERQLLELRGELERTGHVVVPHCSQLCVRLPLLCSVRVSHDEKGFHFRPQFGPFGRTGGLLASTMAAIGIAGTTAMVTSSLPAVIVAAVAGVAILAQDVCRFVLTEGCLSRLQSMAAQLRGRYEPAALAEGSATARPIDITSRARQPLS